MMLRAIAIALSLLIHGSIGYAFLPSLLKEKSETLDLGKGQDIVLTPEGMVVSEDVNRGDDIETLETQEVAPVQEALPPPKEIKPPEEVKEVIASEQGTVEEAVKAEEPPPPKPVEEQKPEVKEVKPQPAQVAVLTEQSSGEEKQGGDAHDVGLYLGKISERVQRAKLNPHSRVAGVVVMRFTVGLDGSLLSKEVATSSGSSVLDEAAVAALDRAAPFPPIPPHVSAKPMAFTQPFKFVVR